MKYFFDTEFIEDGFTIDLISIGIISDDGRTYYAHSADYDPEKACTWVKQNVLPHVESEPRKPNSLIAVEVEHFVGENPEFWADYCCYDWVVLCQLYGTMMDLPKGWPMFCRDIQQLRQFKGNPDLSFFEEQNKDKAHNALWDAKECKSKYLYLSQYSLASAIGAIAS